MRASRGMGAISPAKIKSIRKKDGDLPVKVYAKGGESKVNAAGKYTKPGMRKSLFESIKASATHGTKAGQWSARKAQLLAKKYKASGGEYK
jgi:hypothetical protein